MGAWRASGGRTLTAPLVAIILGAALVWGSPGTVAAQAGGEEEPEGGECCALLLLPVGARATALGGASTARSGPDAVFRNPAGLAGLSGSSFLVHHSDMSLGVQVEAFSLILTPLSSTFGLSYQLFDKGEIATTDPGNQPTGELSVRDHLLVGSFATSLAHGLSAGVNYKLFQQRVDCTGSCGGEQHVATTHAFDVGMRFRGGPRGSLELGAALVNVGSRLQVENAGQADRLPARIQVGAAYNALSTLQPDSALALRVSVDLRDELHEPGGPRPSLGMELDVQQVVFLRAGYTPGEGLGTGAAVGVELRYERLDVAVARSFVNSSLEADTEPFQVSLGFNF